MNERLIINKKGDGMRINIRRLFLNVRAFSVMAILIGILPVMSNVLHAQKAEEIRGSVVDAMTFTQLQDKFYKAEIKKEISLDIQDRSVEQALRKLADKTGLRLTYRGDIMVDKTVTLQEEYITVSDALANILKDTELDYKFSQNGYLLITETEELLEEQIFQDTVRGTVVDAQTGEALPGVNIIIPGTTIGTTTGVDGSYSLTVPDPDSELQYSYIGYETVIISIDGRDTIDLELQASAILGEDLVVTGYSAQRRVDLTGSVSVADVPNMQRIAESSINRQLQGQVSGLRVIQSGQPGEEPQMYLRGIGNFGNVNPLYIVDGVPTSSIRDLNPRDVESLQVLKDASAASIYGARASNGVIIITTSQGRPGLSISLDSHVGIENPRHHGNPYNILSPQEHADLQWMANRNSGITPSSSLYGSGANPILPDYIAPTGAMSGEVDYDDYFVNPFYTNPADLQNFFRITPANHEGTNWFREVYKPAFTSVNNLSISGGTDDATYLMSINHHFQEGTLLETYLERYTVRLNTQFNISENFRVGQNTSLARWENPQESTHGDHFGIAQVYRQQPIIPVRDIAGNYAGNFGAPLGNASNPVAEMERTGDNTTEHVRIFGNFFAELDFMDNFTYRSSFGGSYHTNNFSSFSYPEYENTENSVTNQYAEGSTESRDWTWTNTVTYSDLLAEVHNVNVVLGTETQETTGSWRQASRSGFFSFDPNYTSLATGSGDVVAGNSHWRYALWSLFARVEYNYDNRYLLSGTIRHDGSSRFLENRYGTFPAGSIGWRISQEEFMRNVNWLTNLQIRAGYGIMGNQINVDPENAFTLYGGNQHGTFYPIAGGNNLSEGFGQTRIGNPLARWEEAHNINIGFNAMLFEGSLEIDLDYYQNDIRDLLYNPQLPATAGEATSPFINIGNVQNTGIDASLTGRYSISQEFNITTTLNFTTYRNEILRIAEGVDYFDSYSTTRLIVRNQVGHPISSFYGYKIDGFWSSQQEIDDANALAPGETYQSDAAPGRFRYRDITGDNQITPDDRTILGDPHPDFTYGLDLSVDYRSFDVSMYIYGSQGNDIYNRVRWWTDFYSSYQGAKSNKALFDSWNPELHYGEANPNVTAPIQENESTFSTNSAPNSYYLEDGSFLRLRTVQVGYSLSPTLLDRLGLNRLRIYAQAQNVFTITGYSGPDPEVGATETASAGTTNFGIDRGGYPSSRQFILGFNLEF